MSALFVALPVAAVLANVAAGAYLLVLLRHVPLSRRMMNLLVPVSQVFVVGFAWGSVIWLGYGAEYVAVVSIVALGCAAYDPVLFRGIVAAEEREAAREFAREVESVTDAQREHLARAVEAAAEAEALRRELIEGFGAVERALASGDAAGACDLLDDLVRSVPPRGASFCRNPTVDALLASKAAAAQARGIRFEANADVPPALALPDIEVCAVISNLVDNALAGVEGVSPERRRVEVAVRVAGAHLALRVENPFAGAPRHARRGLLRGVAARPGALPDHGWGLSIVEAIVASHDGTVAIEDADGVFRVRVAM